MSTKLHIVLAVVVVVLISGFVVPKVIDGFDGVSDEMADNGEKPFSIFVNSFSMMVIIVVFIFVMLIIVTVVKAI